MIIVKDREFAQSEKRLTSDFQAEVFTLVMAAGKHGMTDQDIQASTNKGHGSTSSALSTLHKRGMIERLVDKRNKNSIYVLPRYVEGRETKPPMTSRGESATIVVDNTNMETLRLLLGEEKQLLADRWLSAYGDTKSELRGSIKTCNKVLSWIDNLH